MKSTCICSERKTFTLGDNVNCPRHGALVLARKQKARTQDERIDAVVAKAKAKELLGEKTDPRDACLNRALPFRLRLRNRAHRIG
jgi:hypothetical protein